jgi:hypothetical protein
LRGTGRRVGTSSLVDQVAGAADYRTTFWWTIAFTAVAVVLALRLPSLTSRPARTG